MSPGVSGRLSARGNTLICPLGSSTAVPTRAMSISPASRMASIRSGRETPVRRRASSQMAPSRMSTVGSPESSLAKDGKRMSRNVMTPWHMMSAAMGSMPHSSGTPTLDMGVAASSAIMMTTTSSKGCSCPTCRLPISRRATTATRYSTTERTNMVPKRSTRLSPGRMDKWRAGYAHTPGEIPPPP